MTVWSNNLNGITSGTTVTTGNSGGTSGTAFSGVDIPSSGSVTAQSSAAYEGATGLQVVYGSTGLQAGGVYWTTSAAQGTRVAASFWFKFAAAPASPTYVLAMSNVSVRLDTDQTLKAQLSTATIGSPSPAIAPGAWVFVQFAVTTSASNTTRIECVVTSAAGSTLLSVDQSGLATSNAVDRVTFGGPPGIASGVLGTYSFDLLNVNDGLTSGFPGTAPAPAFGATVTLTGSGSLAAVGTPPPAYTGTIGLTGSGNLTVADATPAVPVVVPPPAFINDGPAVTHFLDSFTVDFGTSAMTVNTRSNLEVTSL